MNGDLGKIYNKIIEIETKQEERHTANISRMAKLDNIPCERHEERIKGLGIGLKTIYGIVMGVLLIWVKIALAK